MTDETLAGLAKVAVRMKRQLDDADRDGEDDPMLSRLIADPDELKKHAADYCISQMRERGQLSLMLAIMSPRCLQVTLFGDGMPQERKAQIAVAGTFAVTIALSSVGAYWLATEVWMAAKSKDKTVNRLQPSEREDKREGLMLVTATERSFEVSMYETIRSADGKAEDLRVIDVAPKTMQFGNPVLENLFEHRTRIRGAALKKMSK